jgi:uncharacterized protein (TIGR02147 family)
MSIFSHIDYKVFLKEIIRENQKTRGFKRKLAEAAGCQASLISRLLHSELHLTPDHSAGIAEFLNLGELESDYFETLLHHNRAASPSYRKKLLKRLEKIREAHSDLRRVFQSPEMDSVEAQNYYYSSWIPAAVHIACAIKALETPASIAERLGLSPLEVRAALDRLRDLQLVKEENGRFKITEKFLHISKDSFLISAHHSNWRHQAIASCQRGDTRALHFTGVFAVGRAEFQRLKDEMQKALEQAKATVFDSKLEEELICLSVDAFRVGS